MAFHANTHPTAEDVQQIGATDPTNPFSTVAYVTAQVSLGAEAVILGIRSGSRPVVGCIGYMRGRSIARHLDIPSAPSLDLGLSAAQSEFWTPLLKFSRDSGVVQLEIGSFGTRTLVLPELPPGSCRRKRREYVIALHGEPERLSSNHRRNINRAEKSGVRVSSTTDPEALIQHTALMAQSMERRAERGESVPEVEPDPADRALLDTGAAQLVQATLGERLVSSILVLRAERGAYYQSAGTSPEGMQLGASQYLILSTAAMLRAEGMERFNLGGADPEAAGLQRFKSGFGAVEVELEAASVPVGGATERAARRAVSRAAGWAVLPIKAFARPRRS